MSLIRIVVLVGLLLSACVTSRVRQDVADPVRHGDVDGELVEAEARERYPIEQGVSYDQPMAFDDNPDPVYPPSLLPRALAPVVVAVRLVVDGEGSVSEVIPVQPMDDAEYTLFLASVRTAVSRWRFFPLVRVVKGGQKTVITVGDLSTTYNGTATRLPFTQQYRFTFSQIAGVPSVGGAVSDVPQQETW